MKVIFLKKTLLAAGLISVMQTSNAKEFQFGEAEILWDNTVGYGVGIRASNRDSGTIMPANGAVVGLNTNGSSYNYDDGNLNYKKGDIYTNALKLSSELEINYRNVGGFFRARAYYDMAIMNEDPEFKEYNQATKDAAGRGYELLDAFVYADVGPASLRLGRQVLSWGESTFIQGGINSINPVDAAAFRKAGAEVKDGLLPVNMAYGSVAVNDVLSLEGFYQLEWEKTRSDPCGTFFSTVDFVADGCGPVILGGVDPESSYIEARDAEIRQNTPLNLRNTLPIAERLSDDKPRDSGQYGAAARLYTDLLTGVEFGIYYMNIHSRLPYINGVVTNYRDDENGNPQQVNSDATFDTFRPLYQIAYPEDLKVMGVSYSTSTPSGISIAGEISYKPDSPLQWNAFELILAGSGAPWGRLFQSRVAEIVAAGGDPDQFYGELAQGYDFYDVFQAQTTMISFVDQIFGANRLAIVGEVGVTYVDGLPSKNGPGSARYGRSGAYGIGNNEDVYVNAPTAEEAAINYCEFAGTEDDPNLTQNVNTDYCTSKGFVTEWSGGIRIRSALTYNNVFSGINLTPKVSLSYDMGNGPEPGAQFINQRLIASVGVELDYLSSTTVSLTYTDFSGGEYNVAKDRDNFTLAAIYAF